MEACDTFEVSGLTVKIYQDTDPQNPRKEYDNFGHMVCVHRHYVLGDSHDFTTPDDLREFLADKANDVALALPLFLYDHSGIAMNTSGFSCPWDSGQVGVIYVTREDIRKNWGVKRISKAKLEQARKMLVGEVETYNQYLTDDVYGYVIEDSEGNDIDSCWGFYGSDYVKTEAKERAIHEAKHIADRDAQMDQMLNTGFAL